MYGETIMDMTIEGYLEYVQQMLEQAEEDGFEIDAVNDDEIDE